MSQKFIDDFTSGDKITAEPKDLKYFKFEGSNEIIGNFLRYVESDGDYGVQKYPVIDSAHGEVILPPHKALVSQLQNAEVKEGDKIKVVRGEKKKSATGFNYYAYEIYVKK